jgi:tRNA(adenine34) deaminase
VAIAEGRVLAVGARRGTVGAGGNEVDHAEMVALRRLSRLSPPCDPRRLTLVCTLEPCLMCFAALCLAGIGTVIYAYEDVMGGATRIDPACLPALYRERRPLVRGGVCRTESLALFKTFFNLPGNRYWQGSLLERYTLAQPIDPLAGVD